MAKIDPITLNLSARMKVASFVARLLFPLVALRVLSAEQATAVIMRFVRVEVTEA